MVSFGARTGQAREADVLDKGSNGGGESLRTVCSVAGDGDGNCELSTTDDKG